MTKRPGRAGRQAPYAGWRQFALLFLLPYLAAMIPLASLAQVAARYLSNEIRASSLGAAQESLLERKRIFFELVQAAKRASYEIAHNPDALKLIALSSGDVTQGLAARRVELFSSVAGYTQRLSREIDFYESVFYLDDSGNPVYDRESTELFAVVDPTQSSFHFSSLRGNVSFDGPFVIGIDERSVVVASSPAYDAANRYAGAAGIVIEVSRFFESIVEPRPTSILRYGVLDENGFVMSQSDASPASQGRQFFPAYGIEAASLQAQMGLKGNGSGFMRMPSGQDVLVVWEGLAIEPWTLYATMPAASIKRPILLSNSIAGAALLATALGLAIGMLRTRQLRLKNAQLESAIDELAEAQTQLIRSERSAVLGSAIAGLAHELNTPIGVALTSATFVRDLANAATDPSAAGPAIDEIRKASRVLSSSLLRAGSIIDSFKRVSETSADDTMVVMELGQAVEDSVNVLSRPLQESNTHAVFTRDVAVYVRASTAALNRVIASIVAGVAAWPSHSTPKLFQVLVSGVDEKAFVEFTLHPLPVIVAGTADEAQSKAHPSSAKFAARTIEAGIVKTLVEKDLNGAAMVKTSQDGGFTVTILLDKARKDP